MKNQWTEQKKQLEKYRDASKDGKAWALAQTDKYKAFAGAAPTLDAAGQPLSKNVAKTVAKAMAKQDALHKEFNEKLAKDPQFYAKVQASVAQLEADIKKQDPTFKFTPDA
jgi:hypothetical protein